MASPFNIKLKPHIKNFRETKPNEEPDGREIRLSVLLYLVLDSNIRRRVWVSSDKIADEIGSNRARVIAALKWLAGRGAICNVPHDKRVGPQEKRQRANKHVYQLTGIIKFGNDPVPYLYMKEGEQEELLEEIAHWGTTEAVKFLEQNGTDSEPIYPPQIGTDSEPILESNSTDSEPIDESLHYRNTNTLDLKELDYSPAGEITDLPSGKDELLNANEINQEIPGTTERPSRSGQTLKGDLDPQAPPPTPSPSEQIKELFVSYLGVQREAANWVVYSVLAKFLTGHPIKWPLRGPVRELVEGLNPPVSPEEFKAYIRYAHELFPDGKVPSNPSTLQKWISAFRVKYGSPKKAVPIDQSGRPAKPRGAASFEWWAKENTYGMYNRGDLQYMEMPDELRAEVEKEFERRSTIFGGWIQGAAKYLGLDGDE